MKRLSDILIIVSLLAVAVGCGREDVQDISPASYIFFDSQVETRAELLSDMEGKDFGVMGFEYKGIWSIVSGGQVKPDLFCEQLVEWTTSAHEYSPMKQWNGDGWKYTFFAYYPYGLETSGSDVDGEPYISYTFNSGDMIDLMTSYKVEDVDNTYSNSVGFTMKHRLAALDIYVSNYMADSKNDAVKMVISNLLFKPLLKHDSITLWMDPKYKTSSSLPYGVKERSNTSVIPEFEIPDIMIGPESSVNITDEQSSTMIVIPQDGGLTGTISFDFSFIDASTGSPVEVYMMGTGGQQLVSGGSVENMAFSINKDIEEGQRYYLHIIFINGLVTLEASSSTIWEDKDIEIEIE